MSSDPRVGTAIAGHRIDSVIGRGGMSVVYLAEHLELGRRVALKILGPELAEDEAFRERFIRESRVTAELDHPNIVTVFDAGEADGLLYISMRYVEGSDLERVLRSATVLDPPTAVDIVSQCAEALDTAHARGLVHRDVKPGNILLSPLPGATFHAYLSDFGVTKRIDTGANITRTGQFVGTVDYVAPEQIRSDDVDARADVYSLACVLFRCLTGEVPFPRDTEVGTIYAHLQDPPPVPSERREQLSTGFDAPVRRALSKDRADRSATCRTFAAELAAVVGGAPAAQAATGPTTAGEHRGPAVRRRWLGAVAAAVAIAVVAGGLILERPDGGTASPSSSPPGTIPELAWTATALPTGAGAGMVAGATSLPGTATLLAGWISADGDDDAAVWSATAEGRWTRLRSSAFGGAAGQRISALAANDGVIVAVGSEIARGDTDAAVWRSADDGATWQRVDAVTGGLHRPEDQAMLAVIPLAGGWIAAGWDRSGGDADATIWTSADGTGWTPHIVEPFGGSGTQAIAAMATTGDRVVAVGWSSGPDGDLDAAVWLGEGDRWVRVEGDDLGGIGDQRLQTVGAKGARIVAAGVESTSSGAEAAVWTSDGGGAWVRTPPDGFTGAHGANGAILAVVPIGTGWAAGGWTDAAGARSPMVWLSSDGARWTADPDGSGGIREASGGGGGAVGVLVDPGGERLVAAGTFAPRTAVAWTADVA